MKIPMFLWNACLLIRSKDVSKKLPIQKLTFFIFFFQMKIRQCWARICNTWVRSATIEQIEQRSWALSLCDRPHSSSHSLPARLDTCAARCSVPPTVTFSPADIFLENHECISVYLLFYDSKGLWCLDMMTHASYGLDTPAQSGHVASMCMLRFKYF